MGLIVPVDVDEFLHDLFTNILHGVQSEHKPPPTTTDVISSGIVTGLSNKLVRNEKK